MDRLTSMEAFVRVVDGGGFTAAAEQLKLSRAMVSKHVQMLEDRLGARLLNRTTRRIALTEVGRAYYERCVRILADIAEADQAAAELLARPRGILRLNAPMSFGSLHLAEAVADYMERYPEVSIDLVLNDRVVDLVEEGFDLAVRIGRLADSSLIARRLAPCRLVLCASPAYLDRHGAPRHPQDLAGHHCLDYSYAASRGEWRLDGPAGPVSARISGRMSANNGEALRVAALKGQGVIFQPTFIVGPDLGAGRLVRVLPEFGMELAIHALYPHSRHLSPKVRSFIDFLAGRFGETPVWDEWMAGISAED